MPVFHLHDNVLELFNFMLMADEKRLIILLKNIAQFTHQKDNIVALTRLSVLLN